MKTIGRILIILFAISIVAGVTYALVTTSSAAQTGTGLYQEGGQGFDPQARPGDGEAGPGFRNGRGEAGEFRPGHGEGREGGGISFEWIATLLQVALIVVVVSLIDRRRRQRTAPASPVKQ